MLEHDSVNDGSSRAASHDVRFPALDELDRRILVVLQRDGRIANNALAAEVGIAPSTCLARVRALRESGVIRGTYVDIDPAAVGLPLQALIAVRLGPAARGGIGSFMDRMRALPQVREVYFLGGADDFLLHVVAADTEMLRRFVVEELSGHAEVALTETNLIFAHARGAALG